MRGRWACVWAVVAAGCVTNGPVDHELDADYFACRVEPVLVADCGFLACHGAGERPFRVYGPNRLRRSVAEQERALALGPDERAANLESALAFSVPVTGYAEPLLVSKPLSPELGGAYHAGRELVPYGDVFITDQDPALAELRAWMAGASLEGPCGP